MGRRAIGTLMLLATLSVVGVVVIQLLWLQQASRYRREQVELNKEQALQLEKQFNDIRVSSRHGVFLIEATRR